ncbi:hypothetical protein [Burkholderia contaminans]|uniref:hypothetical protein n=1 Tax=Burkholderia contaminans TaxID=488447 RepID=UPI003D667C9B
MNQATRDAFRPIREPARSIYDALLREATLRKERSVAEWLAAERETVHRESARQAQRLGLRTPTIEEVEHAERLATGHSDYAAKWAQGMAQAMYNGR